jgi:hypothetical protein
VANLQNLVFTLNDGTPITRGLIHSQIDKAVKNAGVKKFVFQNLRNTALTQWARMGIAVDIAMKASGTARSRCIKGTSISKPPMWPKHSALDWFLINELINRTGPPAVND